MAPAVINGALLVKDKWKIARCAASTAHDAGDDRGIPSAPQTGYLTSAAGLS
jgi:hypothetical protein